MTAVSRSGPSTPANVLVVDDDVELCELLSLRLESRGYSPIVVHDATSALARIGRERVDAVLLDLRLPDGDGLSVLDSVAKRSSDVPVIVLTAHGSIETAVDAMSRGAFGFVTKPFLDHDLLQKLGHAIESARLRREVAGLRRMVGDDTGPAMLVGVSAAMDQVRERIARVAPTDATVLVLGESGTGKELVARSIHAMSPRRPLPFAAVNCAALAPELLESTLFGQGDRPGVFETAHEGTVFLDEVGEMPLAVQAKLLRVLQERTYTPLGSTATKTADVRILAATNRDLRQEVAEKRFREDLFYRLHVVPLAVPPLRERRDDIPLLAELFLARSAARHGVPVPRLGGAALAALVAHSWPGNVRELANVMEAAVLLTGTGEIDLEHLPDIGLPAGPPLAGDVAVIAQGASSLLSSYARPEGPTPPALRDARDAFEGAYLDMVLMRTSGNVSLAAKLAGRNRTDFYDLLRRHSRSPSTFKKSG